MSALTDQIKAEARRLGFQLVGITTPDPPPHFSIYERWLAAGRHGEMAYLATETARLRRADPREILPECQSILMLGIRCPSPSAVPSAEKVPSRHSELDQEPLNGRVASYAWGIDYHDLITVRLKTLSAYIQAQAGKQIPHRWYTDTGPILERDLAQRAGLGWIGKNTCLIAPRLGSYFLLAEILLGLALDPDPPFLSDRCGSCTRCLEACPTACILPDRTIDARRCISTLTIELKGAISVDLRAQMGTWVFGCDICQEVCPWNLRFADPKRQEERQAIETFSPRPDVSQPNLIQELSLTPQAFNRKFKRSPVMRAKRRGYLRNVAVALGNLTAGQANQEVVAALQSALLHDVEPLVRAHAAWALGRITGQAARRALQEALAKETDLAVLSEIRSALDT